MTPNTPNTNRWACLVYHQVPRESTRQRFAVSRDRFAAHLDTLKRVGLAVTSLEDAGPGRVAITFDDGLATHYSEAFPLLAERGMKATFFITTSWVGKPGFVSWEQLREMARAGMSIQSHTVTHPFLSEQPRLIAEREITLSCRKIEDEVGASCHSLALPGGDAPAGWSLEDYAAKGVNLVATSRWGPNRGPGNHDLPRFASRYTVRADTGEDAIPLLGSARSSALALEGLRLRWLETVRRLLGPTRYRRVRALVLGGPDAMKTSYGSGVQQEWELQAAEVPRKR